MLHVRHCVECPECHTRYLPGSSPYDNGFYLKPFTDEGCPNGYCSVYTVGRVLVANNDDGVN
jgi:hypothetical protein